MPRIKTTNGYIRYTTHPIYPGIKRIDKKLATENLLLLKDILERNQIAYVLIAGTLLGVVRENDFIDHDEDIDIAWVPGAFEIPLIADKMAKSKKYDAVICLGTVIRGATSHYDYVCNEVSKGIAQVSLNTGIPVLFGVVTTENIEQAIERAGTKAGNKGYDCALSAIEMVQLIKEVEA